MVTATFQKGEVVSTGYAVGTIVTGRVIERHRRSDNKPFLMVEFTSGRRRGERDWPDRGWYLGVGPHEATCRQCYRAFRHQPGEADILCQSCSREDAQAAHRQAQEPSQRSSSWEQKQRRAAGRERS